MPDFGDQFQQYQFGFGTPYSNLAPRAGRPNVTKPWMVQGSHQGAPLGAANLEAGMPQWGKTAAILGAATRTAMHNIGKTYGQHPERTGHPERMGHIVTDPADVERTGIRGSAEGPEAPAAASASRSGAFAGGSTWPAPTPLVSQPEEPSGPVAHSPTNPVPAPGMPMPASRSAAWTSQIQPFAPKLASLSKSPVQTNFGY